MNYITYDESGKIILLIQTTSDDAPPSSLTVTDAVFADVRSNPGAWAVDAASMEPIQAELSLAQVKSEKIRNISEACQGACYGGFTSSALGAVHTYPSKATDQANLGSSVLASIMPGNSPDWTTPFWCADSGGSWAFVAHTVEQIQQVGRDGKAAILANMARKQALVAEVHEASSVADVLAVTW